jgi:hypothetical protein
MVPLNDSNSAKDVCLRLSDRPNARMQHRHSRPTNEKLKTQDRFRSPDVAKIDIAYYELHDGLPYTSHDQYAPLQGLLDILSLWSRRRDLLSRHVTQQSRITDRGESTELSQ